MPLGSPLKRERTTAGGNPPSCAALLLAGDSIAVAVQRQPVPGLACIERGGPSGLRIGTAGEVHAARSWCCRCRGRSWRRGRGCHRSRGRWRRLLTCSLRLALLLGHAGGFGVLGLLGIGRALIGGCLVDPHEAARRVLRADEVHAGSGIALRVHSAGVVLVMERDEHGGRRGGTRRSRRRRSCRGRRPARLQTRRRRCRGRRRRRDRHRGRRCGTRGHRRRRARREGPIAARDV